MDDDPDVPMFIIVALLWFLLVYSGTQAEDELQRVRSGSSWFQDGSRGVGFDPIVRH